MKTKKICSIRKNLESLKRMPNVPLDRSRFLRLDKNESIFEFPQKIIKNFKSKVNCDFISTYPNFSSLYKRIAKWIGCKNENIYIAAGSDAAIKSVFEIFVKPEDNVLILHPTYAMYYVYTHMFQGNLLKIGYKEGLLLSEKQIISCIKKRKPRLICIANPNSPTGTIIEPKSLEKIIKTARENSSVILVDEAYHLYSNHSIIRLINRYRNLIVTRTFSKAFGLASVRLGYAVAHSSMIKNLLKVRPMYETNAFAELLGKMVLDNYAIIKSNVRKTMEGKKYLEIEVNKMGLKYYKSFSNFVNIDVGSNRKNKSIVQYMKKRKILISGGNKNSCLETCIRVTVGPKSIMEIFLRELRKRID